MYLTVVLNKQFQQFKMRICCADMAAKAHVLSGTEFRRGSQSASPNYDGSNNLTTHIPFMFARADFSTGWEHIPALTISERVLTINFDQQNGRQVGSD